MGATKFTIGDKVRIVKTDDPEFREYVRSVDTVAGVYEGLGYPYKLDKTPSAWSDEEIEPAESGDETKFKVGDVVRIVKADEQEYDRYVGSIDTIVRVNERLDYPYSLKTANDCFWGYGELELVESPTTTPATPPSVKRIVGAVAGNLRFERSGDVVTILDDACDYAITLGIDEWREITKIINGGND